MSKHANSKPKYEAPIMIALGDLANAAGMDCTEGTSPATGTCQEGADGHATCGSGTTPMASCNTGTTPTACVGGKAG